MLLNILGPSGTLSRLARPLEHRPPADGDVTPDGRAGADENRYGYVHDTDVHRHCE